MPWNHSKFPLFDLPPIHMSDEEKTKKAKEEWKKKYEIPDNEDVEDIAGGS